MSGKLSNIQATLENDVNDAVNKLARIRHIFDDAKATYNLGLDLQSMLMSPARLVVGGEFSSGKSTFVKMLLGKHVVKTKASASAMPTVHFQYATKPGIRAISAVSKHEISSFGQLTEEELQDYETLEVCADLPFLKQFEIFDTPGTSDPKRDVDQLLSVVDQADSIIWCTNATQAWRESERRMWDAMPTELQQRSILLVTHVDLPSVKSSIDRLMKRLKKDAAPLFWDIIPIELLSACAARDVDGTIINPTAWNASGGADCIAAMNAIYTQVRENKIRYVTYELATKIMPYIDENMSTTKSTINYWARILNEIKSPDSKNMAMGYLKALNKMLNFLDGNFELTPDENEKIARRIQEAIENIKATYAQEETAENIKEMRSIMKQLDWEFHFIDMLA